MILRTKGEAGQGDGVPQEKSEEVLELRGRLTLKGQDVGECQCFTQENQKMSLI